MAASTSAWAEMSGDGPCLGKTRWNFQERKPFGASGHRESGDYDLIVTLLDRLLHHAEVTVIEGDSYRVRESEQETAARFLMRPNAPSF